jgi:hypothetical protein
VKLQSPTGVTTSYSCKYYVGGLFGKLGWGSGNAVITSCESNISVSGEKGKAHDPNDADSTNQDADIGFGVAGGLVGYMTAAAKIENCTVKGNISATTAGALFAAVQYESKTYSASGITFTGSVNGKKGSEATFAPSFLKLTETDGTFSLAK